MPTCPSGKGGGIENRLSEMACGFKSYRWRLESLFHRKNLIQNIQRVIRNGGSFIMSKSLSYVG